MSYYQRHKEELLAKQKAYYRENRDIYLEYMKEYNKKYWLANRPPPREKKVKVPKVPKVREKKEKKPKEKKLKPPKILKEVKLKPEITVCRGSFILTFD